MKGKQRRKGLKGARGNGNAGENVAGLSEALCTCSGRPPGPRSVPRDCRKAAATEALHCRDPEACSPSFTRQARQENAHELS